ncbi:MAG: phosphotriesterase-related protein [Gemmatimonadetes bacterium]|jgi:phosphotriesterase-related protein|nr:phosphotriesterase-related protein [Gemmatimonadota bacterium]MBT6144417.1 phosphotriesterase-related protein [Gemmatimonadota bacterium]MBT7862246.1 phosphotriesterase-related protein [Gemmatimonadota bacterium]
MSRAREVITVRGVIEPSRMGITQAHEHLVLDAMDHYGGYGFVIDDEDLVVDELKAFTGAGGCTICDVTVDEIGRNPAALARISEASGVNVVMGAGWYREFGYPAQVEQCTSNELADLLVREIEVGVGDSGIRAGFIGEIGTGRHHIKPAEERVFRAAALAQARTGVVISTHTTRWGTLALEQIAMLKEYGVEAARIIIGHLGDRRGVHHLLPIAAEGVYIEVDNIGYLDYGPEDIRASNVAALVRDGFVDQILLGEDICMLEHLAAHGGKGYGYLLNVFVPLLREHGVAQGDIDRMLIDNPARAFSRDVQR